MANTTRKGGSDEGKKKDGMPGGDDGMNKDGTDKDGMAGTDGKMGKGGKETTGSSGGDMRGRGDSEA